MSDLMETARTAAERELERPMTDAEAAAFRRHIIASHARAGSPWPTPGCRVLRDSDHDVLAGGPTAPTPAALAQGGTVEASATWSLWDMSMWTLPWLCLGLVVGVAIAVVVCVCA